MVRVKKEEDAWSPWNERNKRWNGSLGKELRIWRLAWAKASKDPRIAADQHSPLEKKILNICLPDAFNLFLLNQRITRGLLDKTYL
uniref:uncharacterized protein LOC101956707 isoform X5 n=1 Tax=Ictidomys tridecemlineatus TaxID=43179 RepID=UPI001A9F7CB0|nr:uncharacterized protein LOC101956707 isoform X5 [Ictidomys tridecemlineatus]